MSELQTKANETSTSAAATARPRISADAFRNLSARLKKTDIAIPELQVKAAPVANPMPVVAAPAIVVAAPVVEVMVPVVEVVAPMVEAALPMAEVVVPMAEAIAPVAEVVVPMAEAIAPVAEVALPMAEAIAPAVVSIEPIHEIEVLAPTALPMAEISPLELLPTVAQEPASPTEVKALELSAIPIVETAATEIAVVEALPIRELEAVELSTEAPAVADTAIPVAAEAALEIVEVEIAKPQFPPLQLPPGFVDEIAPEPVRAAAVELPAVPAAIAPAYTAAAVEPATKALDGNFSDNFTYVPENGKTEEPVVKPDLSGVEEAIRLEVAQRATELELENIWRMLLAKPTAEDRSSYLREAAEIHSGENEWNKPDFEHDLSRIEPAKIAEMMSVDAAQTAEIPPVEASKIETLIVPEGQDMGELARSLLDMMAAGNASGLPQERALAADTLLRLVPRLELKPLVMLAERLAMMDSPPHLLVAKLIRDPRVEVAGPLLEDCSQITDRDLETVVAEGEPAKLRMIARRRNLGRAISDVLIKSGEPSVVLTLVRNMEAEISHAGYQSLLVLAENHDELLAPIATRQDLGAQFAFELFWLAPAQLRRFILTRFLTDSETLTKILKITMATKLDEEGEAEPLNQHILLEGLERAARGHLEVAAEELSGTMQLSTATIQRVLSDLQGDALVVMLKAAGYPRSAVTGLLKRMQDADLPLVARDRDISELQTLFETLSFNKARILLTYWDWAQSKTGPYAPTH